jgi:hypothetical protein
MMINFLIPTSFRYLPKSISVSHCKLAIIVPAGFDRTYLISLRRLCLQLQNYANVELNVRSFAQLK